VQPIEAARPRQPTPKPAKPNPEFPLFAHATNGTCQRIVEAFGRGRRVEALDPQDFERLPAALARRAMNRLPGDSYPPS
jgi:hypothetical protein